MGTQAQIQPKRIYGKWGLGYVLDNHTVKSVFLGYDAYGHEQYETQRSELGELLYRLKYRNDRSVVGVITETVAVFLQSQQWPIDLIVPVPASKPRLIQPVVELAREVGKRLSLPVKENAVLKVQATQQLKDVYQYQARLKLLEGVYQADPAIIAGKNLLLLDDLYRSGATLNVISATAKAMGAANVYVLALTKTRSNI
jgi:competence protein ComFC